MYTYRIELRDFNTGLLHTYYYLGDRMRNAFINFFDQYRDTEDPSSQVFFKHLEIRPCRSGLDWILTAHYAEGGLTYEFHVSKMIPYKTTWDDMEDLDASLIQEPTEM